MSRYTSPVKPMGLGKCPQESLTILICCASYGSMREYGSKSLLPIYGEFLLSRQISTLKAQFPFSDIWLVLGFEADLIFRVFSEYKTVENERFDETNVIRSAGIALKCIKSNNILFVYGDTFFTGDALSKIESSSCTLFTEEVSDNVGCTGDSYITNFAYGVDNKWGQLFYLEGTALESFKKLCLDRQNSRMLGFEGLNEIILNGAQIKKIESPKNSIVEISEPKDVWKCESLLLGAAQ